MLDNIKNKECVICKNIINNDKLDKSLKEIIVEYINQGYKHDEIIVIYNKIKDKYNDELILSSPYYLEIHQKKCLALDLKELREKRKLELNNTNNVFYDEKHKSSFQEIININLKLEEYQKQDLDVRKKNILNMLEEINYMSIVSIYQQLLCGKFTGSVIPKDDISALKNIQDIIINTFEIENKFVDYEKKHPKDNPFDKLTDEQMLTIKSWLDAVSDKNNKLTI